MTDIRTVETIDIDGKYKVTVAESDGDYEASVTKMHTNNPFSTSMNKFLGSDDPNWFVFDDAPREKHPFKYTAVGKAVEAFLEQEDGEE